MSAAKQVISALVAGGMDAVEAAALVAMAAVEMTAGAAQKSSGAIRQQRYRDRNKTSQSVTLLQPVERNETITKRNESVTSNATSLSKEEKKEVIKEKRESRATQLPHGWRPDPKHWDEAVAILGSVERTELELRKFQLHASDKGRLAKNWGSAWVKWALQAIEYGARNGHGTSNHRTDPAAGRATAREAHHVATMGSAALQYLRDGKSAGTGRETPDGPGSAEVLDFGKRAENAR
jgi:hypothetical protein